MGFQTFYFESSVKVVRSVHRVAFSHGQGLEVDNYPTSCSDLVSQPIVTQNYQTALI